MGLHTACSHPCFVSCSAATCVRDVKWDREGRGKWDSCCVWVLWTFWDRREMSLLIVISIPCSQFSMTVIDWFGYTQDTRKPVSAVACCWCILHVISIAKLCMPLVPCTLIFLEFQPLEVHAFIMNTCKYYASKNTEKWHLEAPSYTTYKTRYRTADHVPHTEHVKSSIGRMVKLRVQSRRPGFFFF